MNQTFKSSRVVLEFITFIYKVKNGTPLIEKYADIFAEKCLNYLTKEMALEYVRCVQN